MKRKIRKQSQNQALRNKRYLLKESKKGRTNILNIYNARKAAIDFFFDEYTSMTSEARRQAKKRNRT